MAQLLVSVLALSNWSVVHVVKSLRGEFSATSVESLLTSASVCHLMGLSHDHERTNTSPYLLMGLLVEVTSTSTCIPPGETSSHVHDRTSISPYLLMGLLVVVTCEAHAYLLVRLPAMVTPTLCIIPPHWTSSQCQKYRHYTV